MLSIWTSPKFLETVRSFLSLPDYKTVNLSKLVAFADDKTSVSNDVTSILKGRKHCGKGRNGW